MWQATPKARALQAPGHLTVCMLNSAALAWSAFCHRAWHRPRSSRCHVATASVAAAWQPRCALPSLTAACCRCAAVAGTWRLPASQVYCWRRARHRFFDELEVGCFHMTCRCGYGFCYVCTAQWKSCRCPQWDEGRLVLQARQQVDVQARADNVALNEQQFQQRVQARVEQLRTNHDCRHSWRRRQPALDDYCQHFRHFPLFVYCYFCSGCQMVVCNVCRFHRVR